MEIEKVREGEAQGEGMDERKGRGLGENLGFGVVLG